MEPHVLNAHQSGLSLLEGMEVGFRVVEAVVVVFFTSHPGFTLRYCPRPIGIHNP